MSRTVGLKIFNAFYPSPEGKSAVEAVKEGESVRDSEPGIPRLVPEKTETPRQEAGPFFGESGGKRMEKSYSLLSKGGEAELSSPPDGLDLLRPAQLLRMPSPGEVRLRPNFGQVLLNSPPRPVKFHPL